jgi:hypothetical protein
LRYLILASVAYTANANRKHFGFATTWVIHLTGNGTALLLPEILRLFDRIVPPGDSPESMVDRARAFLNEIVVKNPAYVAYVAPVALAYTVSHPQFNIYSGSIGAKRILGFGADTIPHSAAGFSLTSLVNRMLEAAPSYVPGSTRFGRTIRQLALNRTTTSAATIAALSTIYETSEFIINRIELAETNGDESKINMHWDVQDTVTDLISNAAGWLTATAVHDHIHADLRKQVPEPSLSLS